MRTIALCLTAALGAASCDEPTPRVASSTDATADPPAVVQPAARDPAISGFVRREFRRNGAERVEVVASAADPRPDLAGVVRVDRPDGDPFSARLVLVDVLHGTDPWTVLAHLSRFDDDVTLPLLRAGDSVTLTPIVQIPWLDERPAHRGASDVAPGSR